MKDFFKFTLATVTGIVLSGIVLFIIGVVTLVGNHFVIGYRNCGKEEFCDDARLERYTG